MKLLNKRRKDGTINPIKVTRVSKQQPYDCKIKLPRGTGLNPGDEVKIFITEGGRVMIDRFDNTGDK